MCGENEAIKAQREACVCVSYSRQKKEEWHAHYYRQNKSKEQRLQINGEKKRLGGKWDERESDRKTVTITKTGRKSREREREAGLTIKAREAVVSISMVFTTPQH